MNINWRDMEYEFIPRTIEGGQDKRHHTNTIDAPIMGADTESVDDGEVYEPQCFQVATDWGDELIYLPKRSVAIMEFMDYLMMFEDNILACTSQDFDSGKVYSNRHCLMYFHNLEYDWLQLIKHHELLLEMAKIGVGPETPRELFTINNRKIILQPSALFVGNAPHFTLRIQKNKSHWFQIHFRDTWSYFPTSLEKMMKDLKLDVNKKERDAELGRIDFRDFAKKDPRRIEFEDYSIIDARGTKLAGEKIRELHKSEGMRKIRVSGPSFAIASLYHGMEEGQQIVSGTSDTKMMQLIFDTYRGGRTGGIYHGKAEHVSVYDFHSSYPASMVSLPSFSEQTAYVWVEDLSLDNVLSIIKEVPSCFLRVSGIEHDANYPGLITIKDKKLTPIYGEFKNIATTGVELCVAIGSGTLELTEVHEMVAVFDMEPTPLPFKEFAEKGYADKEEAAKGTADYLKAKLKLNSAYGKLIESQHSVMIGARDGSVILPYPEGQEKEFTNYYYEKYLEIFERGESFFDEYENVIQEVFENMKMVYAETNPNSDFSKEWETWNRERFSSLSISGKVYGFYVVPAAASLITATSRARLCAGMKALDALYWDTDSLFIQNKTPQQVKDALLHTGAWLPSGVTPLTIGDGLGALDCEMSEGSGYLAGTKRYYLESCLCGKCGKRNETAHCPECKYDNVKKAIHGIPALSYQKTESVIHALALGGEEIRDEKGKLKGTGIRYESKPKPLKSKEAPNPDRIGSFAAKEYAPLFHLDERLEWTEVDGGWTGNVKKYG